MKTVLSAAAVTVALLAAPVASATAATAPFNATIVGVQGTGRAPLVALAQSSTQTIDVSNLPANVGLYALHCALPADPRQAPTQCDESASALVYVPASAADRASLQIPIRVNAEFTGINPNPQAGAGAATPVDCRVTSCAVYVLGAGRESANPAYIRVWPTRFTPLAKPRKADVATIAIDGTVVGQKGRKPVIGATPLPISIRTASGLTPTVTGTNCAVKDGTLTALSSSGACVLRITTTGGTSYRPLQQTQVVKITSRG